MFLFTPPIAFSFRELFALLNNLNNLLGAGNFLPLTLVSLVLSSDFMVEDVSEEEGGGKKKVLCISENLVRLSTIGIIF